MVVVKSDGVRALRSGNPIKLGELIDVDVLVTRHELRKVGREPKDIQVIPSKRERVNASAGPGVISVGAHIDENDILALPPEDLYVILAHESHHMINSIKQRAGTRRMLSGRDEEDDARYWEALQATRFEWDEHDYATFVGRLVGRAQKSGDIPYHTASQEIRERGPSFFAVRRRPVHSAKVAVRRHLRHPPGMCLCRKSKTVNRVRRKIVRRLR